MKWMKCSERTYSEDLVDPKNYFIDKKIIWLLKFG